VEEPAGVGADRIAGEPHLGAGKEGRDPATVERPAATGHHHQIHVGDLAAPRLHRYSGDFPGGTGQDRLEGDARPEHPQMLAPPAQGRLQGQRLGAAAQRCPSTSTSTASGRWRAPMRSPSRSSGAAPAGRTSARGAAPASPTTIFRFE
jgi:hypothetical protein